MRILGFIFASVGMVTCIFAPIPCVPYGLASILIGAILTILSEESMGE